MRVQSALVEFSHPTSDENDSLERELGLDYSPRHRLASLNLHLQNRMLLDLVKGRKDSRITVSEVAERLSLPIDLVLEFEAGEINATLSDLREYVIAAEVVIITRVRSLHHLSHWREVSDELWERSSVGDERKYCVHQASHDEVSSSLSNWMSEVFRNFEGGKWTR